MSKFWIGVDLDATLAIYHGWKSYDHIGDPVMVMVARVQEWLKQGKQVKVFTARVWCPRMIRPHGTLTLPELEKLRTTWLETVNEESRPGDTYQEMLRWIESELAYFVIRKWCKQYIGLELPITNVKDPWMIELWDDRVIQIQPNTGKTIAEMGKHVEAGDPIKFA